MKKLAKFLAAVTLVAAVLFIYHICASQLQTSLSVSTLPAVLMDDMFLELKDEVSKGLYEGVTEIGDVDDYCFVTVTVNARSFTPFEAEWVTFAVNEEAGDVLILTQNAGPDDIEAFGSGSYTIELLTKNKTEMRSAILNYYILGRNHSIYLTNAAKETK